MFLSCFQDAFGMFGRCSKAEYFLNNFCCGGGYFLTFLRGFGMGIGFNFRTVHLDFSSVESFFCMKTKAYRVLQDLDAQNTKK